MKNSNDTIGNRTRDLPACSAVGSGTALQAGRSPPVSNNTVPVYSAYRILSDTSVHPLYEINPLNAELNPICHFLALLGGATIVVVSRLRVKAMYLETNHTF